MAFSNRTYDVILRCAPDDAWAAAEVARALERQELRVAVNILGSSERSQGSVVEVARTALTIATAAGLAAGLHDDAIDSRAAEAPILLVPKASSVDSIAAPPGSHTPVWDMRTLWRSPGAWRRTAAVLMRDGFTAERQIEPRFRLGRSHLRDATIASYDSIAEQFAECWFTYPPERELDGFLRQLRPRSLVLDAGCGPGHHALYLARAKHQVVAIDLSEGMLAQARTRVSGVEFRRMDLESLDLPECTFDGLWCAAALLHVPRESVPLTLAGFHRVLKPGGLLGVNFQVGRLSELVQRGPDNRFFEYYPDGRVMHSHLSRAGFDVVSADYGETHRNTHGLDMALKWMTLYARRLP